MLQKLHVRTKSQSSAIDQPVSGTPDAGQPIPPKQTRAFSGTSKRVSSLPKMAMKAMLAAPEVPKLAVDRNDSSIPHEMVPVLTLLASHGNRIYNEGYFMVLSEINNDGAPVADRKWTEVYGTLQGTILTMWDAAMLDAGKTETSFINLTDGYMRSVESLGPELQNVIVLSTTMKNRFLLQFGTRKLFNEWTAALRLAAFERMSLQEAYTGALLSSKGPKLNGIRTMLMEAHHKTELWCNIRFGVGMPWKRVWTVITPNAQIKEKKERKRREGLGKVEFFSDSKEKKKKPLATIQNASAAFAVFPEKSVLMNVSSLIKMECFVEFEGEPEIRESAIFIMPEQHPGVQGFETLIRTLIPLYDVFRLYGRPKRLNADKNDINSLLFGMPTLPRAYYLDVVDLFMIAALPDSEHWSAQEWNSKTKELIARKLAVGYKGSGNIHDAQTPPLTDSDGSSSQMRAPPIGVLSDRQRAVSEPHAPNLFAAMSNGSGTSYDAGSSSSSVNKHAPPMPSQLQHSRPAPRAPTQKSSHDAPDSFSDLMTETGGAGAQRPAPMANNGADNANLLQPPSASQTKLSSPKSAPRGPRAEPAAAYHQRVKSEGENVEAGLLSPQLSDLKNGFGTADTDASQGALSNRTSRLTMASNDSFVSASEKVPPAQSAESSRANLFDPTYRPAHQSYAAYSEYMHQYLKNMPNNGSDAQGGPVTSAPAPSAVGTQPVTSARPTGGAITTAIEVSDDDDDEDEDDENAADGTDDYQTYLNDKLRPSTPPAAQLLSTPIRSPAISHDASESAPRSATRDVSSPQRTALSGPRIPAYPNAPGSPGNGSDDGLIYPKPISRAEDQRRPSGPREEPGSLRGPNPASSTSSIPQFSPASEPRPYDRSPAVTASQPPAGYQQYSGLRNSPGAGFENPSGFYANQNLSQPMGQPAAPYAAAGYGKPPGSPLGGRPSPASGPFPGQGPGPFPGPGSRNPFGPPAGGAYPGPYGPRMNAGPQGAPQGIPQGMPQGMSYGMPNGGGPAAGGPRPMPSQNFGLRAAPAYNPYSQQQPPQQVPQQPSKPGQQPRSFNEARAQQLKSMRAQAMDGGSFGI